MGRSVLPARPVPGSVRWRLRQFEDRNCLASQLRYVIRSDESQLKIHQCHEISKMLVGGGGSLVETYKKFHNDQNTTRDEKSL